MMSEWVASAKSYERNLIKQGKKEAQKEAAEEKIEMVKKLFLKGFTIKEISEIINLSEEKVQRAVKEKGFKK